MSDLKELVEKLKSEASTMRKESKIYFGSDVTEEARKRNDNRQKHQLKEADKYDSWVETIENSISKDKLRELIEEYVGGLQSKNPFIRSEAVVITDVLNKLLTNKEEG